MGSLDTFLNYAMPILVILVFAALIYSKSPAPFRIFFGWIAKALGWTKEKIQGEDPGYETVYKYG